MSTQEFLEKAKELLDRSRLRGKLHGIHWCGGLSDSMFAFSNETDSPDILLVNGSKIVYSASNMTFVSSDGRSILKSPEHVAVSDHGRCCVVCK